MIQLRRGSGIRWPRYLRAERPDGSKLWAECMSEADVRRHVGVLAPVVPRDAVWSVTATDRE